MASSASSAHPPSELFEMIERIIRQADEPKDIGQLIETLPVSFRKNEQAIDSILEQMIQEGSIFRWKPRSRSRKDRFWSQSDTVYCSRLIRTVVDSIPLSEKDILRASRPRLFGLAGRAITSLVASTLKKLVDEGSLFVHPPRQARHLVRYASIPVDPAPYIAKLRAEFDRVMKLLRNSGVTAQEVLQRLEGTAPKTHASFPERLPTDEIPASKEDEEISLPELADALLKTIYNRIPGARNRVPIWLPELRKYSRLSKPQFDQAVLYLSMNGKLHLDRHTHPGSLTEETKKPFVQDAEGVSYVAAVLL